MICQTSYCEGKVQICSLLLRQKEIIRTREHPGSYCFFIQNTLASSFIHNTRHAASKVACLFAFYGKINSLFFCLSLWLSVVLVPSWIFQIHIKERYKDFNPRPRVGDDCKGRIGIYTDRSISIHAPAWGTTHHLHSLFRTRFISIHAPAWGTTQQRWTFIRTLENFNPRPRVGDDTN